MVHDWHVSTSSLWNVCIKSCSPKLSRLLFQLHAFATERIHEIVWGTNLHQFTQKQPHDKNFFCAYWSFCFIHRSERKWYLLTVDKWTELQANAGSFPPQDSAKGPILHSPPPSAHHRPPNLRLGSETESCVSFYLRHFKGKKGGSFRRTIRSALGIPLPIRYILAKSEEVWSA